MGKTIDHKGFKVMDISKQRVLTGVKPTDLPHIGNYIGAIRPAIELTKKAEDSFLFIADYHALNILRDPKELKEYSYQVAAAWLALGLDPDKTVFYRQSDVPEIFEITTLLSSVAPKGLMNRAHAYKAAIDKNKELGNTGQDLDKGINMGLYTYPILMAADILSVKSTLIPVGKDQVQHVEMTRDIAGTFNHIFGEVFLLPEFYVQEKTELLPGIDGRKMSKSYNNHIPLFMDSKKRRKLIMKIMTDSKLPEEAKNPDDSLIYQLFCHFGTDDAKQEMRAGFEQGGMGYGDAKQMLFEAIESHLKEPSERYVELMSDKKNIDALLLKGAEQARAVATETLRNARVAVGL